MTSLVWTPPVGSAITLQTGLTTAGYRLLQLDGIGPVVMKPLTTKSPGQAGSTGLDVTVAERIVVAQVLVQGATLDDLYTKRQALASALSMEPVATGAALALGTLVLSRGGTQADVQIAAIPNSAALVMSPQSSAGIMAADVEWFAPYPFWQPTSDTTVTIASASTPTACANAGDASAPALIRIYGDLTNVTVQNLTTGLSFQITGEPSSAQYVEIDTTPGAQKVTLKPAGTNWMSHLVISGTLFQLAPGANSIQWTDTAAGGSGPRDVTVTYRPRYRGV